MQTHICKIRQQNKAFTKKSANTESYSRGRRGGPAKALVRETVARVRIPDSPPVVNNTNEKDIFEFVFFHLEFFSVIYPLSFIDKTRFADGKKILLLQCFCACLYKSITAKVPFEIYSKILRPQTQ